jgi:hypothetical protein
VRGARYMRLISWTLQSGSEQEHLLPQRVAPLNLCSLNYLIIVCADYF